MICRGDIYYAKLNPVQGSEQGGLRPVLVIQNDKGNKHCPTVIIAPITSKGKKYYLPTHVILPERLELPRRSMVMLEQIRVLDKQRLREYVDCMEADEMEEIDWPFVPVWHCRMRDRLRKKLSRREKDSASARIVPISFTARRTM